MEASTTRGVNRALVLKAAFESDQTTRTQLESVTGLSKATISRVVDELIQEGFLNEGAALHRTGRGRKSSFIELGPATGCVVGVDLGITTCRLWCSDLRGKELARSRFDTPHGLSRLALVRFIVGAVNALVGGTTMQGRLSGIVVAVASSVRDATTIVRPADVFSHIEGEQFHKALTRHAGVPVALDSDSNMALKGEMTAGAAVGVANVALLTVSTGVGAGIAIDGTILRGTRSVIGELGALPIDMGQRRLEDVLSVRGLTSSARRAGIEISGVDDIAAAPADSALGLLRQDFIHGLVTAISTITLTTDPDIVIFNGRMIPLVESVLGTVRIALAQTIPSVPTLQVTTSDGYSAAHGAAVSALEAAHSELLERARSERLTDAV